MEIDKNKEIKDTRFRKELLDLVTKKTKGNLKTIEKA
jgi:hypothetical protein